MTIYIIYTSAGFWRTTWIENGSADRPNTSKGLKAAPGSECVFYSHLLIYSRQCQWLNSLFREKSRVCNISWGGNVIAFVIPIYLFPCYLSGISRHSFVHSLQSHSCQSARISSFWGVERFPFSCSVAWPRGLRDTGFLHCISGKCNWKHWGFQLRAFCNVYVSS